MVRGQLTQQNQVQTKSLETQVLGPILPPPFSIGPLPRAQCKASGKCLNISF